MSIFAVTQIHHVSLIVSDTNRALYFYQKILGFSLNTERPEMSFSGAWLDIGEQQIHLLELPNPDVASVRPEHGGRDRHLALNVTSIERLQDRFKQHGIPYTVSQSGRKAVFCRDPDENTLEFIEVI